MSVGLGDRAPPKQAKPALQGSGATTPPPLGAQKKPGAHGAHSAAACRPVRVEKVPGGQGAATDVLPAQKEPAGQGAGATVPANAHSARGGHGRHADRPVAFAKLPGAQACGEALPATQKEPAGHGVATMTGAAGAASSASASSKESMVRGGRPRAAAGRGSPATALVGCAIGGAPSPEGAPWDGQTPHSSCR